MSKEFIEIWVQLKFKDKDGKIYNLEESGEFEVDNSRKAKKLVVFKVGSREYKFNIIVSINSLNFLGGKPGLTIDQSGFNQRLEIIEKRVRVVSLTKKEKTLTWITIFVFLIVIAGIIGWVVWKRKNRE